MDWLLKGDMSELMKSKYGKFVVKKIVKYGGKGEKERVYKIIFNRIKELMGHQEGIVVVDYYMNHCQNQHKTALKQKIIGGEKKEEKEEEMMENMAMKIAEKGLWKYQICYWVLNRVYTSLIEQERQKIDE